MQPDRQTEVAPGLELDRLEPWEGVLQADDPVDLGADGGEVGIDEPDPPGVRHGMAQVRQPSAFLK